MFSSNNYFKDYLLKNWTILKNLKVFLNSYLSLRISQIKIVTGFEIEIYIHSKYLYPLIFFLNKHSMCQYNTLIDIVCCDKPSQKNRFEIAYTLLSVFYNSRIKVVTKVTEFASVLSVNSLYRSSGWFEREVFDFYGIYFFQNWDLRRILNDYGFKGFPLRKDFPISGYTDVYYDDNQKRICYKAIELSQEYKDFNFKKTWN